MPNELLRTLTIDGVPNDALGVGDFLKLDTDNNVCVDLQNVTATTTVSVPTSTARNYDVYTFDKTGLFMGIMRATFASNANGYRSFQGMINDDGAGGFLSLPPTSSGQTILTVPYIRRVTAGQIAKARLWQNSGSALSTTVYFLGLFIPQVGGGNP